MSKVQNNSIETVEQLIARLTDIIGEINIKFLPDNLETIKLYTTEKEEVVSIISELNALEGTLTRDEFIEDSEAFIQLIESSDMEYLDKKYLITSKLPELQLAKFLFKFYKSEFQVIKERLLNLASKYLGEKYIINYI